MNQTNEPGRPSIERRSEPRVVVNRLIAITPLNDSAAEWSFRRVQLIDCSGTGLGFVSDQPMPVGEQFFVRLNPDDTDAALYQVRRCQLVEPDRYHIGAQLSGDITDAHAQADNTLLQRLLNESAM